MMSNKNIFLVNCTFFIQLIYMKNNFPFIARLCLPLTHTPLGLSSNISYPVWGLWKELDFLFLFPRPESLAHIKVVRLHTRKKGKNERKSESVLQISTVGCFLRVSGRWHTASSLHTTHSSTPEHVSTCANVGSRSSIKSTCISLHNDKKP